MKPLNHLRRINHIAAPSLSSGLVSWFTLCSSLATGIHYKNEIDLYNTLSQRRKATFITKSSFSFLK